LLFSKNEGDNNFEKEMEKHFANSDPTIQLTFDGQRVLTTDDKSTRSKMEKSANWWSKYYASKAKLVN
jgi:hypothetical protein